MLSEITIGFGIMAGVLLYLSNTSCWRATKGQMNDALEAYKYLYKCNDCNHTKTIAKLKSAFMDYYNHRHLTCSITKTKRHTYEIEYFIGNKNHIIEVTIPKGPHASHKKPNAVSIH